MTLTVGRPPASSSPSTRGFWPLRDLPVVGWLVAVVAISLVHPLVPAPRWLMIHLLLLGAAGHAILVWSRYFADTLIRGPATPRREQSQRLVLFNTGVLLVAVSVPGRWWWLVVVGAVAIVVAVGWHVITLVNGLRTGFASRFAGTLRFYVLAGSLLPVGVALGTWLARHPGEPLETRLRTAHIAVNLLGWIGLTVLGTVVTLGPTMLRTRIADGAESRARQALVLLAGGLAVIVAGTLADVVILVPAGLLLYLGGVGLVGWPIWQAARHKPSSAQPAWSFPTWSLAAGLLWFAGLLAALAIRIPLLSPGSGLGGSWVDVGRVTESLTPYFAAGFVTQVLLGALSYLVPVVMGGGPSAVRAMNRDLDAGGALRVTMANAGLLVCVLPVPSLVRVLASLLVLIAFCLFIVALLRGVRRRHRTSAAPAAPAVTREATARPRGQSTGLGIVGLAAVMIAVAVGGALDPAGLGGPVTSAAAGVTPTGHTERVTVKAANMRFTPSRIEVDAGDRLVITVQNTDDADVHDLVLETGHDSGRLAPGDSATLDVGVVGRDIAGWCSVVGHRQMGMTLDIVAVGGAADAPAASDASGSHDGSHEMGDMGDAGSADGGHAMPSGEPAADTEIPDPRLAPAGPGTVHRYTFTVTEQAMEVAPGVTQELWTYNGRSPGPVLHGKVGDRFVITLVNDGTMGHSLDFHAGMRAPDRVMRTIPPGESLTYRFTADRAGVWMYHCSTMPMTAHIANGLFGAVVIDPPDLPAVDRSFLLVQSEHYYGPQGQPVDMDKLLAEQPDAVVFNGYANAYDFEPLRVKVGERVRIWLLNAGPNRDLSFHVVGGQFDTTYAEGDWVLGSPRGPSKTGGSQALGLMPAQGGFVELTFDEPGHYPLVNHVMIDAERGAHGIIEVTR